MSLYSDGDSLPDALETNVDTDGDGRPDFLDTDSDDDLVPDCACVHEYAFVTIMRACA